MMPSKARESEGGRGTERKRGKGIWGKTSSAWFEWLGAEFSVNRQSQVSPENCSAIVLQLNLLSLDSPLPLRPRNYSSRSLCHGARPTSSSWIHSSCRTSCGGGGTFKREGGFLMSFNPSNQSINRHPYQQPPSCFSHFYFFKPVIELHQQNSRLGCLKVMCFMVHTRIFVTLPFWWAYGEGLRQSPARPDLWRWCLSGREAAAGRCCLWAVPPLQGALVTGHRCGSTAQRTAGGVWQAV